MNKREIIFEYLKNNRLKEYERILKKARKAGYLLLSLEDYLILQDKSQKIMILRHDIDFSSDATKKMLEIELNYDATASYYFRKSTIDFSLMNKIKKYGCEASFHFETVSDYILKNKFNNEEEFRKTNWKEICLKNLSNDLKFLREKGFPCRTIAGHGHPICRKFKAANYFLTYENGSYNKLDIELEAYNQEFIKKISTYSSDSQFEVNNGYYYNITPINAINENSQLILFLTHPHHWYFSTKYKIKNVIKNIIRKPINKNVKFELF